MTTAKSEAFANISSKAQEEYEVLLLEHAYSPLVLVKHPGEVVQQVLRNWAGVERSLQQAIIRWSHSSCVLFK